MNQPVSPYGHFKANYKNRITLGIGGFGVVYKAKHRTSGTVDAVKEVLIGTEEDLKESQREVQALQTLEHPSIVPYRTSWLEKMKRNGDKKFPINLYIVMGLGIGTLEKWLEDHKDGQSRKSFETNLWMEQLVDGVSHIHGKGMMHRDLKPENILLFSDCNRFTLKISDFGTAKNSVDENGGEIKHTGGVGSYQYMAPELCGQDKEKYNEAVDVYSLGLILMEILYPMNEGQTNSVCTARFNGQIPKVPKSWRDRWRKMEIPRAFLFCLTDKNPDTRLKYMDILARGGSDQKRIGARMFFSPKKPNSSFWPDVTRKREEKSEKNSEKLDDFVEEEESKVPNESYRETGRFEKEYEVLGTLGSGSFGVVFKARHLFNNREYAVKQVHIEEEEDWEEFLCGVRSHAVLYHPNIVGSENWWLEKATGCLYIAMELGEKTLEKWLEEHPNKEDRDLKITKMWMCYLRDGLYHIHAKELIHRDLKPSNILLFHAKDHTVLKITDSGLAKAARDGDGYAVVQHTGKASTKLYMAQQLIEERRKYDKTVDIYSLGVIFIEMVHPMNPDDRKTTFEGCQIDEKPEFLMPKKGDTDGTKFLKETLLGMTERHSDLRLKAWFNLFFWLTGNDPRVRRAPFRSRPSRQFRL